MTTQLDELVRATPATRDRYVDFLRGASILAVVFGHWFIAMPWREGGVIGVRGAVGRTPGMWLGTWLFQVMPIFFFVGGFSNLVALDSVRRGGASTGTFLWSRVKRLLIPSLFFLAVWTVIQVVLHARAVGAPTGPRLWGGVVLLRGVRPPGQTLPFGPLWFLGVYLAVVLVSPITVALHRRFRALVPALMILGAVVTDLGGFVAGHPRVRYLNIAFVLLLPHQLGHFYGDGTLLRQPRRRLWWMTLSGLGGLVLLTNPIVFELFGDRRFTWFPGIGHYPRSLLGTEVEKVSNAYPPTLCYLLAGLWGIGAAMLLRPRLARWLQRERPWRMTIAVNARIMTLFLWHMTAYLLAILLLWPLEFGREREPTIRWWVERPLWLGVSGAILGVIMTIVGPLEALGRDHRTRRSDDDPGASNAME